MKIIIKNSTIEFKKFISHTPNFTWENGHINGSVPNASIKGSSWSATGTPGTLNYTIMTKDCAIPIDDYTKIVKVSTTLSLTIGVIRMEGTTKEVLYKGTFKNEAYFSSLKESYPTATHVIVYTTTKNYVDGVETIWDNETMNASIELY